MHISHSVPVTEGPAEMKMIWVFLFIGIVCAEKLDRTYLPPPGSIYSGGSPGAIQVPLESSKTKYTFNNEEFIKRPEVVIGIDRVGPNQEDNTFEEISTHKPKLTSYDSFTSQTKPPSFDFQQSSPFPITEEGYSPIPSNGFDNSHQIHNINKFPSDTKLDTPNRAYLPSYGHDIDKTHYVLSSTTPANNDKYITNEQNIIQPNLGKNEDFDPSILISQNPNQFYKSISSTPSILTTDNYNDFNKNVSPNNYHTSTVPKSSQNTPISAIIQDNSKSNHVDAQIPERIQAQADREALIINYGQDMNPDGYAYSYDTSNGIHGDEEGTTIDGVKAKGSYSYIGDDGKLYQVLYTADENGFLPTGAHLPTAPPIPDAILKVIEQAKKDKEAGVFDDGSYNDEKYGHKIYKERLTPTNNVVNRVGIQPKNELFIEREGNFDNFEDSHHPSDIKTAQSHVSNTKPDENEYIGSPYANNFENNSFPRKTLNKSYNSHLPTNEPNDKFSSTQKPSDSLLGYEYFPPQSLLFGKNKINSFPGRTSATDQEIYGSIDDGNITDKVTAKPFLTPYVTHKIDGSEPADFSDSFEKLQHKNYKIRPNEFEKQTIGNDVKYQENYGVGPSNVNDRIDNISGLNPKYDNRQRNYRPVPTLRGDPFYQNHNKPSVTLNPRLKYTASTVAPTETPIHTSTANRILGDETSYQNPPLTRTNLFPATTNSPIYSSSTQANIPTIIEHQSTSIYPGAYGTADLISTPKSVTTSRPGIVSTGARFGASRRPGSITTPYPVTNNGETSTETIIGEDFSGPKQPQRFDPHTGYHY